jgi:hypothetical protein
VGGEAGFAVQPDALVAHAKSVEAAATAVERAGLAAEHVRLAPLAFGSLCQFVPGMVDPVQADAVSAGRASVHALRSAAELLRRTAARYQACEQSTAEELGAFRARLTS